MRYNSMQLYIKKSSIIIVFFLFFSLNIRGIAENTSVGNLYSKMPGFVLFGMVILFFIKNQKLSPVLWGINVFFTMYIVSTCLKQEGNVLQAIYTIAPCLSISFISDFFMRKDQKLFIKSLYYFLIVLVLIDLLTIIVFPDGMYHTSLQTANWFLGYKTERVRAVCMPLILTAGIVSITDKAKLSWNFYIVAIISCLDIYLSGGSGGLLATVFFVAFLFILDLSQDKGIRRFAFYILDFKLISIAIIIIHIMFAFLQTFGLFENLITGVLGKEMTLTGRTVIWTNSLIYFYDSPVIGHGFISSSDYENISHVLAGASPHNLLLGILVYTGVIGIIIFAFLYYVSIKNACKNKLLPSTVCAVFLIANLILGISSFNMFSQFLYASMVLLFYFGKSEKLNERLRELQEED